MSDAVKQEFFRLVKEATIATESVEVEAEPYFTPVLEFVLKHPSRRPEFAEGFVEIIRNPSLGTSELVEFCMHELRWPEVKAGIEELLSQEHGRRERFFLETVLNSFDDDWFSRQLYRRYGRTD
jgi:hypothetical protein